MENFGEELLRYYDHFVIPFTVGVGALLLSSYISMSDGS